MIVEDEEPARGTMRALLAEDPDVELAGETWGERAVEDIRDTAPDLVFLDVRMPHLDGFGVLRRLQGSELPEVVFVTAYGEHALEAFEVRAIDYVLKPFTDERFRDALARAKERVRHRDDRELRARLVALLERDADRRPAGVNLGHPDRIVLQDGATTVVLPPSRISWIEASGAYVVVHVEGREHLVRSSLAAMEERLEERGFVRVHRSAVVNLAHVREVRPISHGDAVIMLQDGGKVKLSRSRRERFEKLIGAS